MKTGRITVLAAAVSLGLVTGLPGCGGSGGGGDEKAIRKTLSIAFNAGSEGCGLATDRMLEKLVGQGGAAGRTACRKASDKSNTTKYTVQKIKIDAKAATVNAKLDGKPTIVGLVKRGDKWLLDSLTLDVAASLGETTSTSSTPTLDDSQIATAHATVESIVRCLSNSGVKAEDQSSNTGGPTVGIDYPGGRTVIKVEDNLADAAATEIAAGPDSFKSKDGLVIVSPADDPGTSKDKSAVTECIEP